MTNFYKNIFKYVTFKTDVKLIQPIFYLISTNKTSNSRMFCLLSLYNLLKLTSGDCRCWAKLYNLRSTLTLLHINLIPIIIVFCRS